MGQHKNGHAEEQAALDLVLQRHLAPHDGVEAVKHECAVCNDGNALHKYSCTEERTAICGLAPELARQVG